MLGQTLAIVRNTFFESIRQPIALVLLVVATLALVFSNLLAGFTMEDDQRMMTDLGLSTVFICGALLAAFVATSVLNREIENRTALTVISKPVARPLFVVGKFLGVASALGVATAYMGFVFLLVERHGVLQTVRDPIHWPVIVFGLAAALLSLGVAIWCNYFYGKVFSSTAIVTGTALGGVAYVFSLMFDAGFHLRPLSEGYKGQLVLALLGIVVAILVLASVAIAASTRLGQILTLCVTLGVFLLGMLSDWIFGRQLRAIHDTWLSRAAEQGLVETVHRTRVIELVGAEPMEIPETVQVPTVALASMAEGWPERIDHALCWAGYALLPNFQVFWLSDAITQSHVIPADYLRLILVYGPLQIVVALSVAVILFQRREVG
jgi:hypothetical protein